MLLALFLQTLDQDQMQKLAPLIASFAGVMFLLMLLGIAIIVIPCWFICKKAGFSPWLSLLCLVPSLGVLILLYILAFADWKVTPAPTPAWAPKPPYPPQPPYPPRA